VNIVRPKPPARQVVFTNTGGEKGECALKKIIAFLKESRAELKKVNWPSKDEVLTSTRVVIISIVIIALVIALVDYVIKTVVFSIIGG
jgi:preprotein translocase subunit SecE